MKANSPIPGKEEKGTGRVLAREGRKRSRRGFTMRMEGRGDTMGKHVDQREPDEY